MFYDFKGQYYVCPNCLRKDYEYYYKIALKNSKEPEDVKISTNSTYPYQELVHYFKNWCFSCANRIG